MRVRGHESKDLGSLCPMVESWQALAFKEPYLTFSIGMGGIGAPQF